MESLEEQLHSNRINSRDFEAITDSGVRRAAASLHENVVLFAEANDVPNDKEVPGEAQFGNQFEFMFHLLLRALDQVTVVLGTVTTFNALGNALLKKAVHRLAVWHRVARELIAQIVQLETEPRRESAGVRDGSRYIAKERIHLPCRAEIAQVVDSEQAARLVEFDMMPDSCKQILNLAVVLDRVGTALRADARQIQRMCNADSSLITPL